MMSVGAEESADFARGRDDIEIVGVRERGRSDWRGKLRPDVLFLDIQMPHPVDWRW